MILTTVVTSAALTKVGGAAVLIFVPDLIVNSLFKIDKKITKRKKRESGV